VQIVRERQARDLLLPLADVSQSANRLVTALLLAIHGQLWLVYKRLHYYNITPALLLKVQV
jgi:hypothetical protein